MWFHVISLKETKSKKKVLRLTTTKWWKNIKKQTVCAYGSIRLQIKSD